MKRVLLTGMSGTGKSSVLREFAGLGYRTVDTDVGGWSVPPDGSEPSGPVQPDWIWDERRMRQLLAIEDGEVLFVAGCVENQGEFYPSFDEVVLLVAAPDVIVGRLRTRTGNDFGKDREELAKVLDDQRAFEPVLRRRATMVMDTDAPIGEVVEAILARLGT